MKKVITPSDAFFAYERAFRARSPHEVEELLREMLNVQVAVVKDKNQAEKELRQGKRLKTVSVPYNVFLSKYREGKVREIYRVNPSAQKGNQEFLVKVESENEIRPNCTYVLLVGEAGYSQEKGLTFEGSGDETGFEPQTEAETREKATTGRFQSWEEHAEGAWNRSKRITNLYRPFIESWAKEALGLDNIQLQSFVDSLIWAMQIAAYLHDVGKLNKKWQETVWENEQKISGCARNGYIARMSPLNNPNQKSELKNPPFHAPFAYPFLRTLLKKILWDYRFLDAIALAAARHHSLEVTGAIGEREFQCDAWGGTKADEWLKNQINQLLNLSGNEAQKLNEALNEAAQRISEKGEADEPPGPTDDFYFLYCITNRLVKVCDWEDAGNIDIELR
jgi:CRISPR-associated endonuclease Cas3-HD